MIEIRMHGRGGQGTVVASKVLADAAFKDGKYAQSFPQYGVERRGAPVTAFTRIADSEKDLIVRSFIYEPDHVVVLDPTLLATQNILEGLKKGGWVVINTPEAPETFDIPDDYKVATVDAASIAVKWRLGSKTQPIVNTAILGAFSRVTGIVSLEALEKAILENAPVKKEENVNAAKEAFESVKIRS